MKRGVMRTDLVSIFIVALFSCAPLPAHVSGQAYPQTKRLCRAGA